MGGRRGPVRNIGFNAIALADAEVAPIFTSRLLKPGAGRMYLLVIDEVAGAFTSMLTSTLPVSRVISARAVAPVSSVRFGIVPAENPLAAARIE